MARIRSGFEAFCCDDAEGAKTIGAVWKESGYLCDPHTAVAAHAARIWKQTREEDAPVVILSTASPYKFPAAVLDALGAEPDGDEFARMDALCRLSGVPVPKSLSGLRDREVLHSDVIDASEIIPYILKKLTEVC